MLISFASLALVNSLRASEELFPALWPPVMPPVGHKPFFA